MKKVSIKTVDGSRFEFLSELEEEEIADALKYDFISVDVVNGIKYFVKNNIVSMTITEVDE